MRQWEFAKDDKERVNEDKKKQKYWKYNKPYLDFFTCTIINSKECPQHFWFTILSLERILPHNLKHHLEHVSNIWTNPESISERTNILHFWMNFLFYSLK